MVCHSVFSVYTGSMVKFLGVLKLSYSISIVKLILGYRGVDVQDFINLHMIIKLLKFLNPMMCNIGAMCLGWTQGLQHCIMLKINTVRVRISNVWYFKTT